MLLQIYANIHDALEDVKDFILVEIDLRQRLFHNGVEKRWW
jgi:hypothetical protein